jgi:hypothetical protein
VSTERTIERVKVVERIRIKNHDGHFITIGRTDDTWGGVRLSVPDIEKLEEVIAEFRRDRETLDVYRKAHG